MRRPALSARLRRLHPLLRLWQLARRRCSCGPAPARRLEARSALSRPRQTGGLLGLLSHRGCPRVWRRGTGRRRRRRMLLRSGLQPRPHQAAPAQRRLRSSRRTMPPDPAGCGSRMTGVWAAGLLKPVPPAEALPVMRHHGPAAARVAALVVTRAVPCQPLYWPSVHRHISKPLAPPMLQAGGRQHLRAAAAPEHVATPRPCPCEKGRPHWGLSGRNYRSGRWSHRTSWCRRSSSGRGQHGNQGYCQQWSAGPWRPLRKPQSWWR
mmetsp:Transcript_63640/g.176494  ORF Transcript_63640/g.176494 Transcript_63640/m.176494 type:complete len:265 (+) Transcript_63640:644-1438(+)